MEDNNNNQNPQDNIPNPEPNEQDTVQAQQTDNQTTNPYSQNPYQQNNQNANPYQQNNQNANLYQQNNQNANPYQQNNQNANPYQQNNQNANPYQQNNQNAANYGQNHNGRSFAIASMILGIVSLVFSCCCTFLAIPCGIVGLIFGILSLKGTENNSMAIAGVIMSAIGIALAFIAFIILFIQSGLNYDILQYNLESII